MVKQSLFVSHISGEAKLATALKELLEREFPGALDVFVSSDRESIRAGANWLQEVKDALGRSPVVIVMCSAESVGRPWVNFEAGGAWIREAPIVPVCHSGMSPERLPIPLKMLNGIEAHDAAGLQKLIDTVALTLKVEPPESDRSGFIERFRGLEDDYRAQLDAAGRIAGPTVLCAASAQYSQPEYGFDRDVAVLKGYFGDRRVEVVRDLTSKRLRELLMKKTYHIVHLVMAVDEGTGHLVFGHIDPRAHQPVGPADSIPARSFADQLRRSGGTELVFLATCWSLFLGVDVARVTNMIATHVEVQGDHVERWADCLYGYLCSGVPLYEAADATIEQIEDVPLRLIPHHDFALLHSQP